MQKNRSAPHASHTLPLLPFIALLIGGTSIGFAGIFMRLSDVNPIASAFWRMALASPFLWLWAIRTSAPRKGPSRTSFTPILAWSGMYFAGDMGLWHEALHYTSVAKATLLSNLAPVFIALFMWKVHKITFARSFLIGLGVALLGAGMLVLGKDNHAFPMPHHAIGDSLGLISALFYAGYQLSIKEARHYYTTPRLMAWSTTITALILLPFALFSSGAFFPSQLSGWLPLLSLAFIAQIGGQTVIAYASAHLPAALSSIGLLIQPLTAAIVAWILFHESISPLQMAGGALLLGGIYLSRQAPLASK